MTKIFGTQAQALHTHIPCKEAPQLLCKEHPSAHFLQKGALELKRRLST